MFVQYAKNVKVFFMVLLQLNEKKKRAPIDKTDVVP